MLICNKSADGKIIMKNYPACKGLKLLALFGVSYMFGHFPTWVNVFRIIPEFRILRMKVILKILNSGKSLIKEIILASLIYFQSV